MEGRCRFTFQPHWLLWAQECCCLCIPENNQNPDYSGLEHFRLRCREFTPLLSFRPQSDRRRREDGVEETRGCLLHHAITQIRPKPRSLGGFFALYPSSDSRKFALFAACFQELNGFPPCLRETFVPFVVSFWLRTRRAVVEDFGNNILGKINSRFAGGRRELAGGRGIY